MIKYLDSKRYLQMHTPTSSGVMCLQISNNGNPIPGDFFLDDFKGGMEGEMHQKRWTHMTVAAIRLAVEMSDHRPGKQPDCRSKVQAGPG